MQAARHSTVNKVVEAARLPANHYGPFHVGHDLLYDSGEPSKESVVYTRHGAALGKGQYGEVYLERALNECARAPSVRAVKELHKRFCVQHEIEWQRELEAMIVLSHHKDIGPFASFYGWYEDTNTVYMSMEFFELGDLSQYVHTILDEDEVQLLAQQLAQGLKIMHGEGIVHRDMKPKNIFVVAVGPHWSVKIADFGCAKRPFDVTGLKTTQGTIGYMAPEYCSFMRQSPDYPAPTAAVDMWSFGCVLYELFTKECPFREENRAFRRYCEDPILPEALGKSFASTDAIHLVEALLHPQPEFRISAEDTLAMNWLAATDDAQVNDLGSTQDALQGLQLSSPALDMSTPSKTGPVSLHSMSSNISLATTVTLVNEPELPPRLRAPPSSSLVGLQVPDNIAAPSLPPRLPSGPIPTKSQTLPPRMEHRRNAPQPPALPQRPVVQSPISPLQTQPNRNAKVEDLLIDFDEHAEEAGAAETVEKQSPRFPTPGLHEIEQENIGFSDLRKYHTHPSTHQLEDHESKLPPPPPPRPVTVLNDGVVMPVSLEPWFVTSLMMQQQLCMSFGPLSFIPLPKPECDLCDALQRATGRRKPTSAQNRLHICENCEGRYLCEWCARQAIVMGGDAHHADHHLREVGPSLSFPFDRFLNSESVSPSSIEPSERIPSTYGKNWLASDHGFSAPQPLGSGKLQVRLLLKAPPGLHKVTVHLRVAFDPKKCASDVIGQRNKAILKMPKNAWGGIQVGAQPATIDAKTPYETPQHYMPPDFAEKQLRRDPANEEFSVNLSPKATIRVLPGQHLEVLLRTLYDASIFKAGSPFRCYIDYVNLSQFGEIVKLASMGEILKRKEYVDKQKKMDKEMKTDRYIKSLWFRAHGEGQPITQSSNQANQARYFETAEAKTVLDAYSQYGGYAQDSSATSQASVPSTASSHYVNAWDDGYAQSADFSQERPPLQHTMSEPTPVAATFESVEYSLGNDGVGSATYSRWDAVG